MLDLYRDPPRNSGLGIRGHDGMYWACDIWERYPGGNRLLFATCHGATDVEAAARAALIVIHCQGK